MRVLTTDATRTRLETQVTQPVLKSVDLREYSEEQAQQIIKDVINANNRNRLDLSLDSGQLSHFPTSFVFFDGESKKEYWNGLVLNPNPRNFKFGVYVPETPDYSGWGKFRSRVEETAISEIIEVDYKSVKGIILRETAGGITIVNYKL